MNHSEERKMTDEDEVVDNEQCLVAALAVAAMLAAAHPHAKMSAEELAKLAQNPVGNLISLPFQNNTNLNFGPEKGTQNILNIQPVIPISVNDDWNIITRTIIPVISMPALYPGDDRVNGMGDTVFKAFLSPAKPGRVDLGRGAGHPVADQQRQRTRQQELGPGAHVCGAAPRKGQSLGVRRVGQQHVVVHQRQARRLVQQRPDPTVRQLQLPGRPLSHQCADLTVNWKAEGGQQWTCPWAAASARSPTWARCR